MTDKSRVPRRSSLHTYVVDRLGLAIVSGEIGPDTRIVAEDLCKQFGVSRTVVREGLRALEFVGMVSARPQVGTTIRPLSDWDLFNPDVIRWRSRSDQAQTQNKELLEVRLGIEPQAARLAASRMEANERRELEGLCREFSDLGEADDLEATLSADIRFHRAILEGSHNAVFGRFGDMVTAMLTARATGDQARAISLLGESMTLHRQLGRAVIDGDPDEAQKLSHCIVSATLAELDE